MLTQSEGLTGPDLLAAFVARRVLPLQGRPHMICQMSGRRDPSRMCTKDMPHEELAYMVNYLSDSRLLEDWRFGKEPYSHANPPPVVSRLSFLSLDCLLLAEFCFDQRALVRIPSSTHQPAPQGRPASSLPTGRRATLTTPI